MEVINAYKNELRKYSYYLEQLSYYSDKKMVAFHKETGMVAKPNDNIRTKGSSSSSYKIIKRLELIDEVEDADKMIKYFKGKIQAVDKTIDLMDEEIGQAIKDIYCLKNSTIAVKAHEIGMSNRALRYAMDDEIKRIATMPLIKMIL